MLCLYFSCRSKLDLFAVEYAIRADVIADIQMKKGASLFCPCTVLYGYPSWHSLPKPFDASPFVLNAVKRLFIRDEYEIVQQ